MENSGIPEQFWSWNWNDWKPVNEKQIKILQFVKKEALALCDNKYNRSSMIIIGQKDSGKSLLASLLLKECVIAKKQVFIAELGKLVECQFSNDENDKNYLRKSLNRDIVCIEIGLETDHKMNKVVIERTYNQRKLQGKYTFFTSRFDLNAINLRYGEDVYKTFVNDKFCRVICL